MKKKRNPVELLQEYRQSNRSKEVMKEAAKTAGLSYARGFGTEVYGGSGIVIDDEWIISHGRLLSGKVASDSRLREFLDNLNTGEMMIMPSEFEDDLKLRVFQRKSGQQPINDLSLDEYHCNGQNLDESEGLVTIAWKCPLLDETFDQLMLNWSFEKARKVNRSLLPIFLMISLKKSTTERSLEITDNYCNDDLISRARSALTRFSNDSNQILRKPVRASFVEIVSTPFGNPVFIDSISHGVVSNVLGSTECVMLTDANAVPGSEGAPVYVTGQNGTRKNLCGMVIAPLSWCRGEWVDYTFAASLVPCFRRILDGPSVKGNTKYNSGIIEYNMRQDPYTTLSNVDRQLVNEPDTMIADLLDKCLVLVRCGAGWGTGIILDVTTGTIITCSHVVHKAPECRIKVVLHRGGDSQLTGSYEKRPPSTWAKLVYRTAKGKPYDVAVLRIEPREIEPTLRSIRIADVGPVLRGEAVGSAGFPFFSSRFPTITRGNVSGTTECMLQTTCCVQSGSSGGPIIRWSTGEMLGMVVCNAISTAKTKLYPRLNMAVPASVLKAPLSEYLRTGQAEVLEALGTDDPTVQRTWNFHLLPPSKI